MPDVRIIVHTMHETERAAALAATPTWKSEHITDAFISGTVDEEALAAIEQTGAIVQVLGAPAEEPSVTGLLRTRMAAQPRPTLESLDPDEDAGYLTRGSDGSPGRQTYFLIHPAGPLIEPWKDELRRLQAEVIEVMADGSVMLRLPAALKEQLAKLSWTLADQPVSPEQSLPVEADVALSIQARSTRPTGDGSGLEEVFDGALESVGDSPEWDASAEGGPVYERLEVAEDEDVKFDILVVEEAARDSVHAWLVGRGIKVLGTGRAKIRVALPANAPEITDIGFLPEVQEVEPYIEPELHNDRARSIMGLDSGAPPAVVMLPLDGSGEIVGVADSGLDSAHPDFQGRIHGVQDRGRPGVTDDPAGHGTHVCGSVLGDGSASGGTQRGAAPGAKLYMQSLLDRYGRLGGLPVDLNDLFKDAYNQGARVHNNSWGSIAKGSYRSNSREVDQFVHEHPDMVLVFSAGNEGSEANPAPPEQRKAAPGYVNWLSIGAPASAKNCITVGASRSDRTSGGISGRTYSQAWPAQFTRPPISTSNISGDPNAIAGFSSRGPTDDMRIKPDVVAPGTDILSCKSSIAPVGNFHASNPANPQYAYDGGTSMAAPLVSGCAAIIRQYYKTSRTHEPSAALVKATLINGTRWLTAPDAVADHGGQPNLHQGFGMVHMPTTLPVVANGEAAPFELTFVDTLALPGRQFTQTGQRHQYSFTLAAPGELRVCLVYTDTPRRALQNNLNLFLQQLPSSTLKWMGNQQMPFSLGGPDTINNVEIIRLPTAAAANYLIQVSAQNLPDLNPNQNYALVVTSTTPITNWQVR